MAVTFVLIPGAGGSAQYWQRLEPELRLRGHDVVAVGLPAADEQAGLAEYADAVVDAIGARGGQLVLVAQSMAGFTAPLVCQRVPVALLVLLNAMIPLPGETPGAWWSATGQDQARRDQDVRQGRPPDAPFDLLVYFFHDVPQPVADAALSESLPQADKPFSTPLTIDRWPDIPTRVLIGRDDRFFPADFQRRVALQRLGIAADEIAGGHLVALSNPRALADRLEAYAAALDA